MIAGPLRAMLPSSVGMALRAIDDAPPPLWPGEAVAVARAVPLRRREFAAGRAAARAALSDAGLPAAALPPGPDRAPCWPAGLCGSISHTRDLAGALAARRSDWPSVGLDLEPALPLDDALAEMILTAEDDDGGVLPAPLAAKLIFSAKEAAFKAQFPLTGLWLDYPQVALRLSADTFRLTLRGTELCGRWCMAGGLFVTVLIVSPGQARHLTGT